MNTYKDWYDEPRLKESNMNIQITEENFLKAHKEGCSDVKKVLENLAPELFKTKYPCYKISSIGNIYLLTSYKSGYLIMGGGYSLGTFRTDWCEEDFKLIKGIKAIEKELPCF